MPKPVAPEEQTDFEGNPVGSEIEKMPSGKKPVTFNFHAGSTEMTLEDARQLSFDDFAAQSLDSTEALGTDQFGPVLDTGNKMTLVGLPFVIVKWNFYTGDIGEFVSAWVITKTDDRFIVNDGSTGIYAQLKALTDETGQDSGLVCRHGLRVSEYDYTKPDGTVGGRAKTFYIDNKL